MHPNRQNLKTPRAVFGKDKCSGPLICGCTRSPLRILHPRRCLDQHGTTSVSLRPRLTVPQTIGFGGGFDTSIRASRKALLWPLWGCNRFRNDGHQTLRAISSNTYFCLPTLLPTPSICHLLFIPSSIFFNKISGRYPDCHIRPYDLAMTALRGPTRLACLIFKDHGEYAWSYFVGRVSKPSCPQLTFQHTHGRQPTICFPDHSDNTNMIPSPYERQPIRSNDQFQPVQTTFVKSTPEGFQSQTMNT